MSSSEMEAFASAQPGRVRTPSQGPMVSQFASLGVDVAGPTPGWAELCDVQPLGDALRDKARLVLITSKPSPQQRKALERARTIGVPVVSVVRGASAPPDGEHADLVVCERLDARSDGAHTVLPYLKPRLVYPLRRLREPAPRDVMLASVDRDPSTVVRSLTRFCSTVRVNPCEEAAPAQPTSEEIKRSANVVSLSVPLENFSSAWDWACWRLVAPFLCSIVLDDTPLPSTFGADRVDTALPMEAIDNLALVDFDWRERWLARAFRAVFRHHTDADRLRAVLTQLGLPVAPPLRISVLLSTNRPGMVDHAMAQVRGQAYPNKEVLLGLHGSGFTEALTRTISTQYPEAKVIRLDASAKLGTCLNELASSATGDLLAKMDDDDQYGPHHLADLADRLIVSGMAMIGRHGARVFLKEEDCTVLRTGQFWEVGNGTVLGGTMLWWRWIWATSPFPELASGEDRGLQERLWQKGLNVLRTDDTGFVYVRSRGGAHSWPVPNEYFREAAIASSIGLDRSCLVPEAPALAEQNDVAMSKIGLYALHWPNALVRLGALRSRIQRLMRLVDMLSQPQKLRTMASRLIGDLVRSRRVLEDTEDEQLCKRETPWLRLPADPGSGRLHLCSYPGVLPIVRDAVPVSVEGGSSGSPLLSHCDLIFVDCREGSAAPSAWPGDWAHVPRLCLVPAELSAECKALKAAIAVRETADADQWARGLSLPPMIDPRLWRAARPGDGEGTMHLFGATTTTAVPSRAALENGHEEALDLIDTCSGADEVVIHASAFADPCHLLQIWQALAIPVRRLRIEGAKGRLPASTLRLLEHAQDLRSTRVGLLASRLSGQAVLRALWTELGHSWHSPLPILVLTRRVMNVSDVQAAGLDWPLSWLHVSAGAGLKDQIAAPLSETTSTQILIWDTDQPLTPAAIAALIEWAVVLQPGSVALRSRQMRPVGLLAPTLAVRNTLFGSNISSLCELSAAVVDSTREAVSVPATFVSEKAL